MYTLLVIDMQPGFLENFLSKDEKERVIKGVRESVVKAIADGAEIIDVNYSDRYGTVGVTIPEIADLWKGYKKLFKRRVAHVIKNNDGGGKEVLCNGVSEDELHACGINAGACVRETVTQLVDSGETVYVIGDAVANSWSHDCEKELEYFEDYAHGVI